MRLNSFLVDLSVSYKDTLHKIESFLAINTFLCVLTTAKSRVNIRPVEHTLYLCTHWT